MIFKFKNVTEWVSNAPEKYTSASTCFVTQVQCRLMPHSDHTPGPKSKAPVRGPYDFYACSITLRVPYGFRDRKQPLRGPWGRAGPVRSHTTPMRDFTIFGCVNTLRASNVVVWHPCGFRTGYKIYMDAIVLTCPCMSRMGPVSALLVLHLYQTESFISLFPLGTRSLVWPREQHRCKIPTGSALRARNRAGAKSRRDPWLDVIEA